MRETESSPRRRQVSSDHVPCVLIRNQAQLPNLIIPRDSGDCFLPTPCNLSSVRASFLSDLIIYSPQVLVKHSSIFALPWFLLLFVKVRKREYILGSGNVSCLELNQRDTLKKYVL